jgi:hypothetical protein
MNKTNLADAYEEFYKNLDSIELPNHPKINIHEINAMEISEEIYFQLSKIHYIGWKHRVNFKRHKKSSLSDIFQDIIAYFLKYILPEEYNVILEKKISKIEPDIIIEKDNKNYFAIELKTTVGYDRIHIDKPATFIKYEKRVDKIVESFGIPRDNIIYIFQGGNDNNGRGFSEQYWNKSNNTRITKRPSMFPYSIIYPLFVQVDPYYWDWSDRMEKSIKNTDRYFEITDEEIKKEAKRNIISPFEEIVKLILK